MIQYDPILSMHPTVNIGVTWGIWYVHSLTELVWAIQQLVVLCRSICLMDGKLLISCTHTQQCTRKLEQLMLVWSKCLPSKILIWPLFRSSINGFYKSPLQAFPLSSYVRYFILIKDIPDAMQTTQYQYNLNFGGT